MFHATVTGNLAADPEMRFTKDGTAVTSFRIAAQPRKRDKAGEWIDGDPTWISVSAWKRAAEAAAELKKGQRVMVSGRVETRAWEDKDGNRRESLELTTDEVSVVVRPPKVEDKPAAANDDWPDF